MMIRRLLPILPYVAAAGGGISLAFHDAKAADYSNGIIDVTIDGQTSTGPGGAISLSGVNLTNGVVNSSFSGNSSIAGGAIYVGGTLNGGIHGSRFTGNSTDFLGGGAVYVNFLNGGITNSVFSGNTTAQWGGAIYVFDDVTGGFNNVSFINNTANRGGAFHSTNFSGDIVGTLFEGNRALDGSGGALSIFTSLDGDVINSRFVNNTASSLSNPQNGLGGALYVPSMNGSIIGTTLSGNTARSGGALYVRAFHGDIEGSAFLNNSARNNGGAATLDAINTGGRITGSIFENNSAGSAGGAIFSSHMDGVAISDSQFLNNTADKGGALFLSTHLAQTADGNMNAIMDVILSASAGQELTFSGNRDSSGANSLYFGRFDGSDSKIGATLTISGDGRIELYDPLRVDMVTTDPLLNDTRFTFTRDTSLGNGELIWGGRNLISNVNGTADFDFGSGHTMVLANYTLVAEADTVLNVTLGAGHVLTLDLTERDGNLAVLDYTQGAAASSISWDAGTTIGVARSLVASEGRYLLIDGYDDVNSLNPDDINFVNTTEDTFDWEVVDDQLWLYIVHAPARSEQSYRPNVRRALRSLDQLIRHTDYGISMSDEQYQIFKDDIDTTPPEAGVTMGLISMQTHAAVVDHALRRAYSSPAGRRYASLAFDSLNAMPAAQRSSGAFDRRLVKLDSLQRENPASPGISRLGAWTPAREETRDALFAASRPAGYSFDGDVVDFSEDRRTSGINVWLGYIGNFASADTHSGYMGYDVDTSGFVVGLTSTINDRWSVGGYTGYTYTKADFDELRAESDAKGVHAGLYTRYVPMDRLSLTLDGALSRFSTTTKRNTADLSHSETSFDQYVYSIGLEAAYEVPVWERGIIMPFGSVRQTWARQDAFTETGGILSAYVNKADTSSFTSTLGVAMAQDFLLDNGGVITPSLEIAWRHEYGDKYVITRNNTFTAPLVAGDAAIPFDTYSLPRDRDVFKVGVGVQSLLVVKKDYTLGLKAAYSLEISENYTAHGVFGGMEMTF